MKYFSAASKVMHASQVVDREFIWSGPMSQRDSALLAISYVTYQK